MPSHGKSEGSEIDIRRQVRQSRLRQRIDYPVLSETLHQMT